MEDLKSHLARTIRQTDQFMKWYGGDSISGRSRLRLVCPKLPVRANGKITQKSKHAFKSIGEIIWTMVSRARRGTPISAFRLQASANPECSGWQSIHQICGAPGAQIGRSEPTVPCKKKPSVDPEHRVTNTHTHKKKKKTVKLHVNSFRAMWASTNVLT